MNGRKGRQDLKITVWYGKEGRIGGAIEGGFSGWRAGTVVIVRIAGTGVM